MCTLEDLARKFADEVNELISGVIPNAPEFKAVLKSESPSNGEPGRVWIVSVTGARENLIPLTIKGEHRLDLRVIFHCTWDSVGSFLAIERSSFEVNVAGDNNPLFRYEYLRRSNSVPAAHLHVHAERDEMTDVMAIGQERRPKRRRKNKNVLQLADLHFPLGGSRFRPCIEDVLQMLIREFAVDTLYDWEDVIRKKREKWRRRQISAAVRDAPEEAAEALRELGYAVSPPASGPHPDNPTRLSAW